MAHISRPSRHSTPFELIREVQLQVGARIENLFHHLAHTEQHLRSLPSHRIRDTTHLSYSAMSIPSTLSVGSSSPGESTRNLMTLFDSFDANRDGVIDREEFRRLYEQYGPQVCDKLTIPNECSLG